MSFLTGKPASVSRDTSSPITLSRSALLAAATISDSYYTDLNNWNSVILVYRDATKKQVRTVLFTANSGSFVVSAQARLGVWELNRVILSDFDGDTYEIAR